MLGAEISYANQNADSYEHESDKLTISPYNRKVLTLLVMNRIIKNFIKGEPALNAVQLSGQLDIPLRLIRESLDDLVDTNILSEIITKDIKEMAYQPSMDPNIITVDFLMNLLDKQGNALSLCRNLKKYPFCPKLLNPIKPF